MISIDYRVEATGTFSHSHSQTAALLDRNVATALNTITRAAHKIITDPIPAGPSGIKKAVKLERAKVRTEVAAVRTSHPLAEVVEVDTDPHEIRPRGSVSDMVSGTAKKALRFKYKGKVVFAKKVNHPGTKGKYSWKRADQYVEKHLAGQLRLAVDAAIEGRNLPIIDSAILSALQSLL